MKTIELRAVIDTGSMYNFISKEFIVENYFKIHGLRLEKSKIAFGINQEPSLVDRVSFIIIVANWTFHFRFIVLPGFVPTCILGTNSLTRVH